jgi:hypothetical protein
LALAIPLEDKLSVEIHLYCTFIQYNSPVDEMTPTQWIAKCAERLHERWVTVGQAQLEETAVVIWTNTQLRHGMTPLLWIRIHKHLNPRRSGLSFKHGDVR